ncbi:unnamed protein product, partial [Discosporangium mesarthrocarpum]
MPERVRDRDRYRDRDRGRWRDEAPAPVDARTANNKPWTLPSARSPPSRGMMAPPHEHYVRSSSGAGVGSIPGPGPSWGGPERDRKPFSSLSSA